MPALAVGVTLSLSRCLHTTIRPLMHRRLSTPPKKKQVPQYKQSRLPTLKTLPQDFLNTVIRWYV